MKSKLSEHKYLSYEQFKDDLDRICKNSYKFNEDNEIVIEMTKKF